MRVPLLHPIIILSALFLPWKFLTMGRALPKYNTVNDNWVKKRIISHYQCCMRHVCLNRSKYRAIIYILMSKCVWFLQDNVLSTVKLRNFVWQKFGIVLLPYLIFLQVSVLF